MSPLTRVTGVEPVYVQLRYNCLEGRADTPANIQTHIILYEL